MKFADAFFGPIHSLHHYGLREVDADSIDTISVSSNGLLFRGDYLRDGADLIVRGDGETLIVHGYFTAQHRPKLVAPNGGSLSDTVVDALARPVDGVEVAQAGAPTSSDATAAIGRVQTLSGSATVVRNGVSVALHVGDLVYKGDVVQTGAASSLAISFLDGTLFSLAASARMVLSEMVYSANGADNNSLFELVQGSIHFVAGKVAKTGDMKVGTPLATMGIRGTYVGAEIDANDGTSRVSVITEPATPEHPDGYTGAFDVYGGRDPTNLLFRVVDPNTVWTIGPDGSGGVAFRSDPKSADELSREARLAQEVFRTLAEAPRLPVYNGPATGGGTSSGNEPAGPFGPNPAAPGQGSGNPPTPGPSGPPRPDPLFPLPGQTPGSPTPDNPPLVFVPADPNGTHGSTPDLALTPRSVALLQGDVRVGLGEQSVLAGAPANAQLIAVRSAASARDVPVEGAVTLEGRYGLLTLSGDGAYTYQALNAASLAEGQQGADVFFLTVGRSGATGTTTLRFEVTGTNDAPFVSGPITERADEDGAAARLSALAHASDIDAGTQLRVVDLPSALPPGVRYDAVTETFQLDPSDAAYQSLAEGQTLTVTVSYGVTDGKAVTPTSVSWTVTGVNDAPVVSGAVKGSAQEGGAAVRLLALAHASDVDTGTQLRVVDLPSEYPPGVTYDATSASFLLDPTDIGFQSLGAGQTRTITLTYGVSDGFVTVPASVSWTVTGVNDAPTVEAALTGGGREGGTTSRLDLLAGAHDVDAGDTLTIRGLTYAIDGGDASATIPTGLHLSGTTLTLDASDPAFDSLAVGQSRTIVVRYTIQDGQGGAVAQSATLTVVGTNDAPVVSGPVTGVAREDGTVVRVSALANASDVDAGSRLDVVAIPTELPPGVRYDAVTKAFLLDPADAAYQALAAGETRTVSVDYGVSDGRATTRATVSFVVTGVNDAPVVTGPVTGSAREDGAEVRLSAYASASDVDAGSRLSVVDVPTELPPGVSFNGETGMFRLDPSVAAFQSLAAGQTRTVTVNYGVGDGTAVTPAAVSWTVTGVNDAPVVSGPVSDRATEDGAAVRLDALANASDVDAGAELSVVGVPEALPPGVSYDQATKTFLLDPSHAAYQSLAEGQTRTISVSYAVSDGLVTAPASVAWTVTGANDAPRVSGPVRGSATEDGVAVRLDALAQASDIDAGAQLTVVTIPAELPPGVSYDAVTKAFQLDPSNAAYQSLSAGQTETVTVRYGVSDGIVTTPASVVWTVSGVNDAPTVGGDRTIQVGSGGSVTIQSADLHASDPDNPGGPFRYTIDSDANPHGLFTVGDAIVTRFTQADIDAGRVVYHRDDTLAGHVSDRIAFSLDDGAGGVTRGSLIVTVPGPDTRQDNVVRASDDAEGDLDIPIEAILFNDHGGRPLDATDVRDSGEGGHLAGVTDRTVTVTQEASTQSKGAFTYRAQDADGFTGNVATVFVNVSTSSSDGSIAVGAGQDDDVLFASRYSATTLDGNAPGLTGGADRSGHDVYVFTQTPPEAGDAPIHRIAGFSAGHDAIALPFLDRAADGGPADPAWIDGLVQIRGSEVHGYDLFVSWNLARGFQQIAHFDAGTLQANESVTVIWNDRSAAVTVMANASPTVSQPLTSETREGDESYAIDLLGGASDADGDGLTATNVHYAIDGQPTEGSPWGLSLEGSHLYIDPSSEGFADLGEGEIRTIRVDYTVDDGHGGTVAQSATITITGTDEVPPDALLPVRSDNVVMASHSGGESFTIPVEALLFNDIGDDGLRPSFDGITAVTPTDPDRYVATVSSGGGAVTVSPSPQSGQPEPAFTYRAYDGTDRGSEVATVRISTTEGVSEGYQAHGSGQNDDILIASPFDFAPTTLDGNVNGTTGSERTGHDVFVFMRDPAGSSDVSAHRIVDFSATNDAIDLTFLEGSGASAETIDDFVSLRGVGGGYDLYARSNPTHDMLKVAHIDTITMVPSFDHRVVHAVTVIWRDHIASVAIPELLVP